MANWIWSWRWLRAQLSASCSATADGTFQPLTLLPVYTYWPVVADFNGDGIPDIATTTLILNNGAITSYAAVIYAGNGDGTFRQLNTFPFSSAYGTLLAARDVNGDGELDLIFDGANGFTVCLGQGGEILAHRSPTLFRVG